MNVAKLELTAPDIKTLRGVIVQYVQNVHDAEDILQETLLKVWVQSQKQTISQPLAYALRIAKHLAYKQYRTNHHYCSVTFDNDEEACSLSLDDSLIQQQHLARISQQLQLMSTIRRDILVCRWTTDKARACIAKELNISEESVKKHLYRGTKKLQQELRED